MSSRLQSEYRRPESVLVLVYTSLGDVLLMARKKPADFWQSVTGSLEHGELAIEAAQRELFEETGLKNEVVDHQSSTLFEIKPPWHERYAPEHTHNREHRFSTCLKQRLSIQLAPDEHVEARWLNAADALKLASSPSNREAIRDIALPLAMPS